MDTDSQSEDSRGSSTETLSASLDGLISQESQPSDSQTTVFTDQLGELKEER